MKISDLSSNIMTFYQNQNNFKEDSILLGKIIEILDDNIIVDFKEQGTVQATLEGHVEIQVGDERSFLVKSVDDTLVQLKLLTSDEGGKAPKPLQSSFIAKILEGFDLKETEQTKGLIKQMIDYNIPLTDENISKGIGILDKLEELANVNDLEKIVLVDSMNKDNHNNHSTNVLEDKYFSVKNSDIKYLFVRGENEYPKLPNLTNFIKDTLGTGIHSEKEADLFKIIGFLINNNIKPSLNNINNLRQLNNDPLKFVNEIKESYELLKDTESSKLFSQSEQNKGSLIEIQPLIKGESSNELENLRNLVKALNLQSGTKITDKLININDKINFLEDLNKELSFLFAPINLQNNENNGILTLIKDKRKKQAVNKGIYVYLNMPTQNLGTIKANCQLLGDSLYIRMNIEKEDLELFESTQKLLIDKISLIGYSLKKIDFITDGDLSPMDSLISHRNPLYILDVRV